MSLSANLVTPRQMRAIMSPPGNHRIPRFDAPRRHSDSQNKNASLSGGVSCKRRQNFKLVCNAGVVFFWLNLARKFFLRPLFLGFLTGGRRPAVRGAHAACFAIQARFLPLQVSGLSRR